MARKREIICDRCEKVIINLNCHGLIEAKESSAKIFFWGVGQPRIYGGNSIDLCTECANSFTEFLENRKATHDKL